MSSTETKEIVHHADFIESPPRRVATFDLARYDGMRGIAAEMSKSDLADRHGE